MKNGGCNLDVYALQRVQRVYVQLAGNPTLDSSSETSKSVKLLKIY